MVNCRMYDSIEPNDETHQSPSNPLSNILKKEEKRRVKELLWMSTNIAFKDNVDRNYRIALLRLGLNGSSEEKTYKEIACVIRKEYSKNMSGQGVKVILDKIFVKTRSLIGKERRNGII